MFRLRIDHSCPHFDTGFCYPVLDFIKLLVDQNSYVYLNTRATLVKPDSSS